MYYIVYISSASPQLSENELLAILEKARVNNAINNVTGILLYIDGNIIQTLEGEEDKVTSIFNKILMDRRHTGVLKLLEGPLAERNFPDWSMGFKSLTYNEASEISGYKNLNKESLLNYSNPSDHPGMKLVKAFVKSTLR